MMPITNNQKYKQSLQNKDIEQGNNIVVLVWEYC